MFPSINEQMDIIRSKVVDLLHEGELVRKLETSLRLSKPLIVKLGCDPTKPDLHLGHAVVLRKMRQLQDLGHQAVLIVGDFTGMIGDPSGRDAMRAPLSFEETRENGKSYFDQAAKILDLKRVLIAYNSDWLAKLTFWDIIQLTGKYMVGTMLDRSDFQARYIRKDKIGIHELLYPLAQAMDSVTVGADIELGGTDQKDNLAIGREIQVAYGQEPQVIVTMPILRGIDGCEKMSKSLGNYIGIAETPVIMYEKILGMPDTLLMEYYELLTKKNREELESIRRLLEDTSSNSKQLKLLLARELIATYHSPDEANLLISGSGE